MWERLATLLYGYFRRSTSVVMGIGAVAVVFMMLHIVASVLGRYLFNNPIPDTMEIVSQYYMPIATLLPLAYVQVHQEHVRVLFFTDWMPTRPKVNLDVIAFFIAFLLCVALGYYGFEFAYKATQVGEYTASVPRIPIWASKWMVPVGFWLLAVQFLADTILEIWRLFSSAYRRTGARVR